MPKIHEILRTYHFPDGHVVSIPNVRHLKVSDSGNHRIITSNKNLHIVPTGWNHIEIKSNKGWEM